MTIQNADMKRIRSKIPIQCKFLDIKMHENILKEIAGFLFGFKIWLLSLRYLTGSKYQEPLKC